MEGGRYDTTTWLSGDHGGCRRAAIRLDPRLGRPAGAGRATARAGAGDAVDSGACGLAIPAAGGWLASGDRAGQPAALARGVRGGRRGRGGGLLRVGHGLARADESLARQPSLAASRGAGGGGGGTLVLHDR